MNFDAQHRETMRAALRGHDDKLVKAIASKQAQQDTEWKQLLRDDLTRTRNLLRQIGND